jgi:hypothetical protein
MSEDAAKSRLQLKNGSMYADTDRLGIPGDDSVSVEAGSAALSLSSARRDFSNEHTAEVLLRAMRKLQSEVQEGLAHGFFELSVSCEVISRQTTIDDQSGEELPVCDLGGRAENALLVTPAMGAPTLTERGSAIGASLTPEPKGQAGNCLFGSDGQIDGTGVRSTGTISRESAGSTEWRSFRGSAQISEGLDQVRK